jgi:glucose-fructose oxidoreductase
LSPSYTYGKISGYTRKYAFDFQKVNQQALHMDGISNNLITGVPHLNTGGDEGLRDMKVIDAIFKSASANGKKVMI